MRFISDLVIFLCITVVPFISVMAFAQLCETASKQDAIVESLKVMASI